MRRVGEFVRRGSVKLASAVAAGGLVLTGCGEAEPHTEEIPINRPVPPREDETSLAPTTTTTPNISVAPTPTSESAPVFTGLTICQAIFVDKRRIVVKPASQNIPGQKVPFPMQPFLYPDGGSHIDPAQAYSPGDYFWTDLQGRTIDEAKGERPDCPNVLARVATVSQAEIRNVGNIAVLAGSQIVDGQVVDISDPGEVLERGEIYHVEFGYDSHEAYLDLMRSVVAGK